MKLVVGFLLYNKETAKYLVDFLPSLEKALAFLNRSDFKVLIYDNSDQTEAINHLAVEKFNLVSNNLLSYQTRGNNLGFGRAYNILINKALTLNSEYFLMLNPDMLLEPGAINFLLKNLDEHKNISAVSPKIYCWDFINRQKTKIIDSLGLIVKRGLRFYDLGQGAVDQGQFDHLDIIGPSGAAGLFRLSDLEKIAFRNKNSDRQFFDEQFFMYKEDCDVAYRFYLAKLKSQIVPSAIIYHDRSSESGNQQFLNKLLNRFKKKRQIRTWSLKGQNILYTKYWKNQNFVNKIFVIFWFFSSFIFSLILEQFSLKVYFKRN